MTYETLRTLLYVGMVLTVAALQFMSMVHLLAVLTFVKLKVPFTAGQVNSARGRLMVNLLILVIVVLISNVDRLWQYPAAMQATAVAVMITSYVIMIRSKRPPRRRLRDRARAKLRTVTAWRPPVLQPAGAR